MSTRLHQLAHWLTLPCTRIYGGLFTLALLSLWMIALVAIVVNFALAVANCANVLVEIAGR